MKNKITFLPKKYSMAIAAGVLLSTSSVQAEEYYIYSVANHCLTDYAGQVPKAHVTSRTTMFHHTGLAPAYLTAYAAIEGSFNPETGEKDVTVANWNMLPADPSGFTPMEVSVQTDNPNALPSDQYLVSHSTVSGPGISYAKSNYSSVSSIPPTGPGKLRSCVEKRDYQMSPGFLG